MRYLCGLAAIVLAMAGAGCIGSVSAVLSDDATRFEPGLLGTWIDSGSKERAVITRRGARGYSIQYTDDQGQVVSFDGVLGRSAGHYFLDVQPIAAALGPYKDLVLRLHIPVMLDSIGTRIHSAMLEPDSLDQYLRRFSSAVPFGRTNDGLALKGSSTDVERFLGTYVQRSGALARPSTWSRRLP